MRDLVPFVLVPGWVKSRTDGDLHYVDGWMLHALYGMAQGQCVVFHEGRFINRGAQLWPGPSIWLGPRADGQYAVARAEAVIAHVEARSAVLRADIARLEARYPLRRHRSPVMVDLETLGTEPGSGLLSIGAVAFDPVTGKLAERFYVVIDRGSNQLFGLVEDPETLAWWARQSAAARRVFDDPCRVPLYVALDRFSAWWRKVGGVEFWAHGPGFDEALLSAAYRATDRTPPWKFWNARCTRTIYAAADVAPDRASGTHHNALDDAVSQAAAVIKAYRRLGLSRPRSLFSVLLHTWRRLTRGARS